MVFFKKYRIYFLVSFLVIFLIIGFYLIFKDDFRKLTAKKVSRQSTTKLENKIDYVAIIVMENKPYDKIVSSSEASFFNQSFVKGSLLTNYFGLKNPSLQNYLGLIGGDTFGANNNCTRCFIDSRNLIDLLEEKGKSWKAYMEGYPGNCFTGDSGVYAQRHNPFIYFNNIRNNPKRCEKIVTFQKLTDDLASISTTPNFIWITPDLCHDTHDCSIKIGDDWLKATVDQLTSSKAFNEKNYLVVITYDEGDLLDNRVATLLLGPTVRADFKSNIVYDHYSMLRTIESIWGLGSLGKNDAKASVIGEVFK